jgi:hypothetical protein
VSAKAWHVAALNPNDGMPLTVESNTRTALFLAFRGPRPGGPGAPEGLGCSPPPARARDARASWGGLTRYASLTGYPHLIAACEIYRNQTHLYLIGKDGVHTPPPLPHGLLSIEEAAMKELSAPDGSPPASCSSSPPRSSSTTAAG